MHVLGIFDFVVAGTAATLSSGAFPAVHEGAPASAPMEVWPLILFPALLVPLFICLHLAALLQARAGRAGPAPLTAGALGPI